jgi:hypothetical protein
VRTDPLVGDKAWFGPRRFGWGLSPISVEGWVATGASLMAMVVMTRRFPDRPVLRRAPALALVAISIAKGTAPGGARARAALRAGGATVT